MLNLSDPAAEDAIYDRSSFQKFLSLDLISDKVPDETTILNFRHLLEKHNLSEAIFDAVNHFLEEKNLLVKEGTSLDATLIAAPTSTKNTESPIKLNQNIHSRTNKKRGINNFPK